LSARLVLSVGPGRAEHPLGFVQGEMPGIAVDQLAASAGRVWLDAAGSQEYPHAFGTQGFDAALEWWAAGQGGVDERQDDGRDA
jgi:hypothetical protein